VGDALRVGLCEADADFGCEAEPVHDAAMLAEPIAGEILGACISSMSSS
jgi:hypothetical protein